MVREGVRRRRRCAASTEYVGRELAHLIGARLLYLLLGAPPPVLGLPPRLGRGLGLGEVLLLAQQLLVLAIGKHLPLFRLGRLLARGGDRGLIIRGLERERASARLRTGWRGAGSAGRRRAGHRGVLNGDGRTRRNVCSSIGQCMRTAQPQGIRILRLSLIVTSLRRPRKPERPCGARLSPNIRRSVGAARARGQGGAATRAARGPHVDRLRPRPPEREQPARLVRRARRERRVPLVRPEGAGARLERGEAEGGSGRPERRDDLRSRRWGGGG